MAEARRVEEAEGRGDVRVRNQRGAGMCGNSAGRHNPEQLTDSSMSRITVWGQGT